VLAEGIYRVKLVSSQDPEDYSGSSVASLPDGPKEKPDWKKHTGSPGWEFRRRIISSPFVK